MLAWQKFLQTRTFLGVFVAVFFGNRHMLSNKVSECRAATCSADRATLTTLALLSFLNRHLGLLCNWRDFRSSWPTHDTLQGTAQHQISSPTCPEKGGMEWLSTTVPKWFTKSSLMADFERVKSKNPVHMKRIECSSQKLVSWVKNSYSKKNKTW